MADGPLVAVMAAGRGSRFGGGKLDAPCAGRPLGQWALDAVAAAGLPRGVIVAPPQMPAFARDSCWEVLENPAAADGMGTSVAAAAREAIRRGAPAMLVLLADMPLLDAEFLRRLAQSPAPAAALQANGRPGAPALLAADLFAPLSQLTGDRGAASVLAGRGDVTLLVPPDGMLADVDTAQDLAEVSAVLRGRD